MNRHTLTEEESKEAALIIEKYRDLERELTSVQEQLLKLDALKEELLSRLERVRTAEELYFSKLSEKHGEGKLDLLTFEYVTKQQL